MEIRDFSKLGDHMAMPDLVEIQTSSYERYLQPGVASDRRKKTGLEALLRESFPIESFDGKMKLDYLGYELGKPRYSPDECRKLRLTYGMPFKIQLRLMKDEPVQEWVYLGELPIMMGGGEFIINGAERVIVSQLHRSPGVDFLVEGHSGERRLHSCRIIPERGSWIELDVSKKDVLTVRIDQSGKFPVTTLLRAMDEKFSSDADLLRLFYKTEKVKLSSAGGLTKARTKHVVGDVVNATTGVVIVESGEVIGEPATKAMKDAGIDEIEILTEVEDPLLLNTIREDQAEGHDDALLRIHARLRPGNPAKIDKARALFAEKFFDANRYRLGRVGRFRLNRKFGQKVDEDMMILRPEDLICSIRYIARLRAGDADVSVDDIDHLGNRRLRTIDELANDELRKGFLRLRRTVQERMSLKDPKELSPRSLINSKTISSAIDFFFGGLASASGQNIWQIKLLRGALMTILSGALIPLQLLPWGLGAIFGWLPFASMASAPLRLYTGTGDPLFLIALQVVWCILLWPFANWMWMAHREKLAFYGG